MSVVLIDAVRTPFGKAGSLYNGTRADDLVVRAIRGLLERNPQLNPADIDDVAIAAATQTGDQGMNIGRSVSILAGLPTSVPGYSIDRWCAGAMTSVTTLASSIAAGAYELAIAMIADIVIKILDYQEKKIIFPKKVISGLWNIQNGTNSIYSGRTRRNV